MLVWCVDFFLCVAFGVLVQCCCRCFAVNSSDSDSDSDSEVERVIDHWNRITVLHYITLHLKCSSHISCMLWCAITSPELVARIIKACVLSSPPAPPCASFTCLPALFFLSCRVVSCPVPIPQHYPSIPSILPS